MMIIKQKEELFSEPHRIIYFDNNGFIYRIIYPLDDWQTYGKRTGTKIRDLK